MSRLAPDFRRSGQRWALFLLSRDARSVAQTKAKKTRFTSPPAFPVRATASPANGFSRITNHETRITAFMFFTNHETRDTKHGFFQTRNTAFPWLVWCSLVLKPFSLVFSAGMCSRLTVMTPLLGTKNLIHARRGRSGWRRQSRPSHGLSGIYETRDPGHGVSLARGASRREFRGFHETRDTRHETRLFSDPKHGFSVASMVLVGTEALQSFFSIQACLA